jgi:hypothetical protein
MVYDLPLRGKRFLMAVDCWTRSSAAGRSASPETYTRGAIGMLIDLSNWGFAYGGKRVSIVQENRFERHIETGLDPRAGWSMEFGPAPTQPHSEQRLLHHPGTFELGNSPTYINALRDPNATMTT